jgi:hypothetical protein
VCCYDKILVHVAAYVIPKYNIVVCCYDKILVNVAVYVIRNYTKLHTINTTYKLPEDSALTPKHVGVILI